MVWTRLLEVAASNLVTRNLSRDREHWHSVAMTIEQAVDEVKIARSAAACTDGDLSGKMGLRTGGKCSDLFVPHM
jgi:hypothetical protein